MVLVAIIFALGAFGVEIPEFVSSIAIQVIVMFAIPFALYTLMISKNPKQTFKDAGFKKISFKMIVLSLLIGIILYSLNTFVSSYVASLLKIFGYEKFSSSIQEEFSYTLLFKEFVFTCIFPGIFEEFLHRGILLHAGKKCGNTRYCLILSSVLFGLMHLNIYQFGYATVLGFLIGYIGIVSDSIYPCMIIHFTNNFLSTYFAYGTSQNWPLVSVVEIAETFLYNNLVTYILVSCLLIYFFVVCYIYLSKKMLRERTKYEVSKIIKYLKLNYLSVEEAKSKINLANNIIAQCESSNIATNLPNGTKFSLLEKLFYITSIVMGGLIVISSFIWGII